MRINRTTTLCEVCEAPVTTAAARRRQGRGRFCSLICRNVAATGQQRPSLTVARICQHCGMPFRAHPYRLKLPRGALYCSHSCLGQHNTIDRARTLTTRFWAKVDKSGPIPDYAPNLGPCWLWTAGFSSRGYGVTCARGKSRYAYALAWELTNGPVGAGLVLDHLCCVKSCVRPSHLDPVTQGENVHRASAYTRWVRAEKSLMCT